MTLKNTATQYQIGRPEWSGSWESHTHNAFKTNQGPVEKPKSFKMAGSQICFGTDNVSYVTHTKSQFKHETDKYSTHTYQHFQFHSFKAFERQLGEDRVEYKTAAMNQFCHPSKRPQPNQPTYKNYNQRVDIITGQVYDPNRRMSPYEGFTEAPQHKRSQNQTVLPVDLYVQDPITGRQIIRKVKDQE